MDKTLILGCANFGNKYGISGGLDKSQCFDILDAAWDMGIRWLDTARSYGESEEIIGEHNKEWNVISKGDTRAQYKQSTICLNGKLKQYFLHHFRMVWSREIFAGVSVYSPINMAKALKRYSWTSINFPLNLIDQRFSTPFRQRFSSHHIARSIFIQGQAFNMPKIMGIPFYHLCWNFVINHPNVDMVCFGADSVKQLEDIMKIPQYSIDYSKIGTGEKWIKSIV